MASGDDVIRTLMAMGQIYGKQMNEDAAAIFVEDLEGLDPDAILKALKACRRELRYFPTLADILDRVQSVDGRPGAEEAWALIPKDEFGSVVWSDEMAEAYSVAGPLIREGDLTAGRMAFKEKYQALVKEARDQGRPVRWTPSLGFEQAGRVAAVRAAIDAGRIGIEDARHAVPEIEAPWNRTVALPAPAEPVPAESPAQARRIRELVASLGKPMPEGGPA